MPWSASDAEGFTSAADTPEKQEQWAAVANGARESCIEDGGTEEDCDALAIRTANAAVQEESMELGSVAWVDLGDAGKVTLSEALALASEAATLKATAKGLLKQLSAVLDQRDVPSALRKELNSLISALRRKWADLGIEAEGEHKSKESSMDTVENGYGDMPMAMPSGALSFDSLDAEDEARAYAARAEMLMEQFRALVGNVLWAGEEVIPDKAAAMRELVDEFIARLSLEPEETQMAVASAAESGDSDVAQLLVQGIQDNLGTDLAEAELTESRGQVMEVISRGGNGAGPLKMRIALIEPGLGNSRDKHLYEAEMLRRDAHVFEGVKMYATDHKQNEKSVRTEVSQIIKCPVGFTETGAPIAEVGVFDPTFAETVRNRESLGLLSGLHCSILAKGKVKKAVEFDGQKVNRVEQITMAEAVDWVTQAGAGGRALSLVESAEGTEGTVMTTPAENDQEIREDVEEPEDEEQVEEATLTETEDTGAEATEEAVVTELSVSTTLALLLKEDLPNATRARIAERAPFESAEALTEAIDAERAYLNEVAPKRTQPKVKLGPSRPTAQVAETDGKTLEERERDVVTRYLNPRRN